MSSAINKAKQDILAQEDAFIFKILDEIMDK